MEWETVVLEEETQVDLGDAQAAYEEYPQLRETLAGKKKEYVSQVEGLTPRVSTAEAKRVDALAEEIESTSGRLSEIREVLLRKLEGIIIEVKSGEANIAAMGGNGDEGLEACRSLITEALQKRNSGDLIAAIQIAFRAYQGMAGLTDAAKTQWRNRATARASEWRILDTE